MKNKITLDHFKAVHEDPTEAFQTLALRLMAHDLGIPSWAASCPRTWPGVECDPVEVNGKFHSFQAKFYSKEANGWTKLKVSLRNARDHVKAKTFKLDVCHIYLSWEQPSQKLKKTGTQKDTPIDQCEKIAAEGGFKLTWNNFGDQIIERLRSDDAPGIKKLTRQFFTFPDQPKLEHPTNEGSAGIAKYHYAAKSRLEYVERPEVVAAIDQLISSERSFAWHTIVGSAGVGKSRSILEYCHDHLDESWKWGWLKFGCDHEFSSWEPDANFLIVVDYAMGRGNQLYRLLSDCISQQKDFHFKVRVLVAERMAEPWMQAMTSAPINGTNIIDSALFSERNSPTPHVTEIRPFKKDGQLRLSEMALVKCPELELTAEELADHVRQVDDEFRPLLVWLCAEHLKRGEDLRYAEDLLSEYLNHQRIKNWHPGGVTDNDETNTALVTMCQGLTEATADKWTDEARERAATISFKNHAIILGGAQSGDALRPMEPDIVGELHALNSATGTNPLDTTTAGRLVADAALLNPWGLVGFLFRAASDFPAHDALRKFLAVGITPEIKMQIMHFLIIGLNKPGANKNRKKVAEYLNLARQIGQASPSPGVIQNYAAAVTNSTQGFTSLDDVKLAKSHLYTLRSIMDQASDPQIYRSYVGAIQNLFAGDRLAPLDISEKLNYVRDLQSLLGNEAFTEDSYRSFIDMLSREFSAAVREDSFSESSRSRMWLVELERALATDIEKDQHVRAVLTNSLITAAGHMHQAKEYAAHSALVEKIAELIEYSREQDLGQFAATLAAYVFNDRDGNNSNPDSRRLLLLLAEVNPQARSFVSSLRE